MAICAPVIGLWYWCTDQYIVQRALGAPNEQTARRGSIFAAFLKLFPVYLFIIPGLICFALAKSGKVPGLAQVMVRDGNAIADAAQAAFPLMVKHLLPPGLRGIVVAGLLSALMGSLAGVFNACSTLFTVDLYEKWSPGHAAPNRPHGPHRHGGHGADRHGVDSRRSRAARASTNTSRRCKATWRRRFSSSSSSACSSSDSTPRAASAAMIVGFIVGVFRMLVDTPVTMKLHGFENGYSPGSLLWIVNNINFQYFSVLITIISAVVMVAVSYATPAPEYEQIKSLTFGTATEEDRRRTRASWNWREVLASAFVLAAILGAYLYFRG